MFMYVYVSFWFWLDFAWNSNGPYLRWGWNAWNHCCYWYSYYFRRSFLWFPNSLLGWFQEVWLVWVDGGRWTSNSYTVTPPYLPPKKARFGNVLYARFGKANLRLFWQPIWCISLTWSATGQVTFRSLRFTDGRYVFLSGVESVLIVPVQVSTWQFFKLWEKYCSQISYMRVSEFWPPSSGVFDRWISTFWRSRVARRCKESFLSGLPGDILQGTAYCMIEMLLREPTSKPGDVAFCWCCSSM